MSIFAILLEQGFGAHEISIMMDLRTGIAKPYKNSFNPNRSREAEKVLSHWSRLLLSEIDRQRTENERRKQESLNTIL